MTAYTFDQIIDFTRTSAATYVANTGFVTQTPASRNLLTYTQEFDNAAWTKTNATALPFDPATATYGPELVTNGTFDSGTTGWTTGAGWSITGGQLVGTTVTGNAATTQTVSTGAGRWFAVTFTVVSVSAGQVSIGMGASLGTARSSPGTYTEYFIGTAATNGVAVYQRISDFTGTIDNISVREVIGGLITAPDGTLTGDALIEDATNAAHTVSSGNATVALGAVTWSVYAKAGTRSWMWLNAFAGGNNRTWFNLANGTVGTTGAGATASITSVGNGWYRCAVTLISGTTTVSMGINAASADNTTGYAGTAGATAIYLWGAQLEAVPDANLVLGSEIRSTGSIVTVGTVTAGSYNTSTGEAVLPRVDSANVNQVVFTSTSGKNYRVDIQNTGAVAISVRSGSTILSTVAAGQRATVYAVVAAPQNLSIWPNSDAATATATIHSVKEITGTTGMPTTYTRNVGGVYPPRFDYDPVTLAPRGLLIEEQRTNLLTYSEQFDNAAWTKINATVTANSATSPDGTVDADLLVASTSLSQHRLDFATTSTAAIHAFSVYAKVGGYNFVYLRLGLNGGFVDLSSGAVSGVTGGYTMTATSVGNGWYRVVLVGAAALNETARINVCQTTTSDFTGDGTSGIYLWGAQLEAGAFATSYIPTVASQVTRTADLATVTGANFSRWYNQSEGTFVIEARSGTALISPQTMVVSDGTNNERIMPFYFNGSGQGASFVADGNVTQANVTYGASAANTLYKAAFAYRVNDFAGSVNGGAIQSDASGTLPTVDRLWIGSLNGSSTTEWNGHIRRIRYYPTRLSNTQLQALTA